MDYIPAGTENVSLVFALTTGGLTISAIKVSAVRYTEGDGTSFAVIGPTALTALGSGITTAHTDNYGLYLDTETSSGAYFLLRVDVPDTYFATGKDRCVVSVYDDAGAEIAHRIFRLTPVPANVKQISDDATAADNLESACDNYSATRGLAGTALPAAAADAAGGLPISDAGALDLDTLLGYLTAAVATAAELAKVPKSDAAVTWNATALASINAECDTALTDAALATEAKQDIIDTVVDAIKVKTDQLTFTEAGNVDANIQYVNNIEVTGDGETGTEWGPV